MQNNRPKPVRTLRELLKAAVEAGDTDNPPAIMAKLGPHASAIAAHLESHGGGDRMRIEVEPYLGIDVRTDQKTKTALELASTLGVPDTTIAATRGEAAAARRGVGVGGDGRRGPPVSRGGETAQHRPARTWRLSEVDPEGRAAGAVRDLHLPAGVTAGPEPGATPAHSSTGEGGRAMGVAVGRTRSR